MKSDLTEDIFGKTLRVQLFGGSHTKEIGVHVEGFPAGIAIDEKEIQKDLTRRRPGRTKLATPRNEKDLFQFQAGIENNKTTGETIILTIPNTDTRSKDYSIFKEIHRPSQVDYPAILRYGPDIDLRGSGRFSGRLTAPLVAIGSIAKQVLAGEGIKIGVYTSQVGNIRDIQSYSVDIINAAIEKNDVRTVDPEFAKSMANLIETVRDEKNSIGGAVTVKIEGFPKGIGDPWFQSLESQIAATIMAIPATRGIEFGAGFQAAEMRGSQHNDPYILQNGHVSTKTNNCGGIICGISIGTPIIFRVPIKPTASIGLVQHTLNFKTKKMVDFTLEGRHDPCIVPRIVVALEGIIAILILDILLTSGYEFH